MIHRILQLLMNATLSVFPTSFILVRPGYYAFKIVTSAPSGTPDAAFALNVAAGVAGNARIYTDNAGAWAAQTT